MLKEMGQCPDYRRIPIFNLTQGEIMALISIGSMAFGEPMGDSLIHAWLNKKDQTAHLCIGDQGGGFLIVDNSHESNGIHYIELVAIHPPTKGLGTVLHEIAFEDIIESSRGTKTILVITQNPAEILAFKKAANKLDQTCFPFDRIASIIERGKINTWLSIGSMRNLKPKPRINFDLCILYDAFRNWQPPIDRNVRKGELSQFLLDNNINFDKFCNERNAFILGCSFIPIL